MAFDIKLSSNEIYNIFHGMTITDAKKFLEENGAVYVKAFQIIKDKLDFSTRQYYVLLFETNEKLYPFNISSVELYICIEKSMAEGKICFGRIHFDKNGIGVDAFRKHMNPVLQQTGSRLICKISFTNTKEYKCANIYDETNYLIDFCNLNENCKKEENKDEVLVKIGVIG
jgi:hypothetical protein